MTPTGSESVPPAGGAGPRRKTALALLVASSVLLGMMPVQEESLTYETARPELEVTAPSTTSGDEFGAAVAVDGDRIVVGAPGDDDAGENAGAIYVITPDGYGNWVRDKLIASDGAAGDQFGWSVAVSGDRIAVGVPFDDDFGADSGSVYLFEADGAGGWTEAKLDAGGRAANLQFGYSVGIAGDWIAAGAPFDMIADKKWSGSVYLFARDTAGHWAETKLSAADPTPFANLGWSVAVSDGRVVAGAPAVLSSSVVEAAHVFEQDGGGWTQTMLKASDEAHAHGFGRAVAVSGDRVVVGAPNDEGEVFSSGAAYVFDRGASGTWVRTKLYAADGRKIDDFGEAIAIVGERVAVGARRADLVVLDPPDPPITREDAGAVYVFEEGSNGEWTSLALIRSHGSEGDWFGASLAATDDRIVAGIQRADVELQLPWGPPLVHADAGAIYAGLWVRCFGRLPTNGAVSSAGNVLTGTEAGDVLVGTDGRDRLIGGDGNDYLCGGGGNDRLRGGPGSDRMDGEAGHDVLRGSSGDDTLRGGSGNDRLNGDGGIDLIDGGGGDDLLAGGPRADDLRGARGNDLLRGGPGNDVLNGGPGMDTADFSTALSGVVVDLARNVARGGDGRDRLALIENADGSPFGDRLYGDNGDNDIRGLAGDDLLKGGDGNDTLVGSAGADRAYGQAGRDRCRAEIVVGCER